MKREGSGFPPNVVTLHASRPRPPGIAAILIGKQLVEAFLKLTSEADRQKVLDLARQLAADQAARKT